MEFRFLTSDLRPLTSNPEIVEGLAAGRSGSQVKCSLGRWCGEPGVETQEVGGKACLSQIQGE